MKRLDAFIIQAAVGLIFLLVNIISVYLLLRGHNLPGGGFIGGLATGMSFILLGLVRGWTELQRELPIPPLRTAAFGLLLAITSGLLPMVAGQPFLTQYNFHTPHLPLLGEMHLGTPLLFDIGVYLLVSCITLKLVLVLARSTTGLPAFTIGERPFYASVLEEPIEDADTEEKVSDAV